MVYARARQRQGKKQIILQEVSLASIKSKGTQEQEFGYSLPKPLLINASTHAERQLRTTGRNMTAQEDGITHLSLDFSDRTFQPEVCKQTLMDSLTLAEAFVSGKVSSKYYNTFWRRTRKGHSDLMFIAQNLESKFSET